MPTIEARTSYTVRWFDLRFVVAFRAACTSNVSPETTRRTAAATSSVAATPSAAVDGSGTPIDATTSGGAAHAIAGSRSGRRSCRRSDRRR